MHVILNDLVHDLYLKYVIYIPNPSGTTNKLIIIQANPYAAV